MHELSIAVSMVDMAVEESLRRGDVRVNAIHLKLGALSGVVKDALLFLTTWFAKEHRWKVRGW